MWILDDGQQILIDIDSRSKDDIESHLLKVIGKSKLVAIFSQNKSYKFYLINLLLLIGNCWPPKPSWPRSTTIPPISVSAVANTAFAIFPDRFPAQPLFRFQIICAENSRINVICKQKNWKESYPKKKVGFVEICI